MLFFFQTERMLLFGLGMLLFFQSIAKHEQILVVQFLSTNLPRFFSYCDARV